MAFLETPRFPTRISFGSTAGPRYNTNVVIINSGFEKRNAIWSQPLNGYNVATGVKAISDLEELVSFFHAVGGRHNGFRFKDWSDFKSVGTEGTVTNTDQTLGTGDGVTTEFQLVKKYTQGVLTRTRNITKPVSVKVAVDGVAQTEGTGGDFDVDYTTGIITFNSAPSAGESVTAGFEYDVPVRFDTDELPVSLETYRALSANVPLVEIRIT